MAKTPALYKSRRNASAYPNRIRALFQPEPKPLTHPQIAKATGAPYAKVRAIVRHPLYRRAATINNLPAWVPVEGDE